MFQSLTSAEIQITKVIGEEAIQKIRSAGQKGSISNYPGEYGSYIEQLSKAAKADLNFLKQLKSLSWTEGDDPRIRELVDIATRQAKPNEAIELSVFCAKDVTPNRLRQFLDGIQITEEGVEVPSLLLSVASDMTEISTTFTVGSEEDWTVAWKITPTNPRMYVNINDGTNNAHMSLTSVRGINMLLSWIADVGVDSVDHVARAISVFSECFEGNRKILDMPLMRSGMDQSLI